jgi:membrane-associated phospholipid phosphatase
VLLRRGHKALPKWAILLLWWALALPQPAQSQQSAPRRAIGVQDVASVTVASAMVIAPRLFNWGPSSSSCAPCDRNDVPGFDRWAIHTPIAGWSRGSDVLVIGMVLGAVADLARQRGGEAHLVAALQAGMWAEGLTELTKVAVARKRPVLYTSQAPDYADQAESLRSFPSGHTSGAFAVATSWWLSRRDLTGSPGVTGWLAVAGAVGMGAMRVAAGKHFPSDVLAGAALGVASGVVVHVIKF